MLVLRLKLCISGTYPRLMLLKVYCTRRGTYVSYRGCLSPPTLAACGRVLEDVNTDDDDDDDGAPGAIQIPTETYGTLGILTEP